MLETRTVGHRVRKCKVHEGRAKCDLMTQGTHDPVYSFEANPTSTVMLLQRGGETSQLTSQ